jgi:hypothetical protein
MNHVASLQPSMPPPWQSPATTCAPAGIPPQLADGVPSSDDLSIHSVQHAARRCRPANDVGLPCHWRLEPAFAGDLVHPAGRQRDDGGLAVKQNGQRLGREAFVNTGDAAMRHVTVALIVAHRHGPSNQESSMTSTELIGWAAASKTLLAFTARDVRLLRLASLGASVAFITYGAATATWPVLALHCVLLPVNLFRLRELRLESGSLKGRDPQGSASLPCPCQHGAEKKNLPTLVACGAPGPADGDGGSSGGATDICQGHPAQGHLRPRSEP